MTINDAIRLIENAMMEDLDHSVHFFNEAAALEFKQQYPAIYTAIGKIVDEWEHE
jgi:hypothetical protein